MNVAMKGHRTRPLRDLRPTQIFSAASPPHEDPMMKLRGRSADGEIVWAVRLSDGLNMRFENPDLRVFIYDANLVLTPLLGRKEPDDSS